MARVFPGRWREPFRADEPGAKDDIPVADLERYNKKDVFQRLTEKDRGLLQTQIERIVDFYLGEMHRTETRVVQTFGVSALLFGYAVARLEDSWEAGWVLRACWIFAFVPSLYGWFATRRAYVSRFVWTLGLKEFLTDWKGRTAMR